MFFSVGFATRDDFHGAWMTVESLLAHHDEFVDQVVIIDNSPTNSRHADCLQKSVKGVNKVKYVRFECQESSCLPKNRVFEESDCEFAACCDSHVLFVPDAIRAMRDFWKSSASDTRDLLTGPCRVGAYRRFMGTNQIMYEHEGYEVKQPPPDYQYFAAWRGGSLGCWVVDPRGRDMSDPPFVIRKQGTGLFSMRKDAWAGFHPNMYGHGGNETYLYEKVRRKGGLAWCLPAAQWIHRFPRPEGAPYSVNWQDRIRNYRLGFRELQRPDLERGALAHFNKTCPNNVQQSLNEMGPVAERRDVLCKKLGVGMGGVCPEGIADLIRQLVRPGMPTLELGSGYSTLVFDEMMSQHTALEHNEKYVNLVTKQCLSAKVVHAPLGENGAYFNAEPPAACWPQGGRKYELVLVDGPPNGKGGDRRDGALQIIEQLAVSNPIVIIDDTHRPGDAALSARITEAFNLRRSTYAEGKRKFDLLMPKP